MAAAVNLMKIFGKPVKSVYQKKLLKSIVRNESDSPTQTGRTSAVIRGVSDPRRHTIVPAAVPHRAQTFFMQSTTQLMFFIDTAASEQFQLLIKRGILYSFSRVLTTGIKLIWGSLAPNYSQCNTGHYLLSVCQSVWSDLRMSITKAKTNFSIANFKYKFCCIWDSIS